MSRQVTLLVEIGCEEIPARMLDGGARQLAEAVVAVLERAGLSHGEVRPLHTPRRLAVLVRDVPARTPEREELLLGPPAKVAWDEQGEPTRAALGFAKKQGLEVGLFEKVETERGVYAGVKVRRGGEGLGEVLAAGLPERVVRMAFPKSMRWGRGDQRFVRPVHWVVALADEVTLPLELLGVRAGRATRGHRSLAPGEHEVPAAAAYERVLEEARVIVDPQRRRAMLERGLRELAASAGGRLLPDEELLDESAGLVELPGTLAGGFDERFVRELPREVLATCLRHHQKAFSLLAEEGDAVLPAFAVAVNVAGDPAGHIRRGHEWVIGGRLDDALFFWNEDRRAPLAERREELSGVVFHKELGTYAEKTLRTSRLAARIAETLGLEEGARAALGRAAELARCDLVTGLVGEFPELQGVVGGLLARADGEPEDAWRAIYDLYRPAGVEDALPATRLGLVLGLADRLDSLAGGFAVGLEPSGSSDPFALRRAGLGVVRLASALGDLRLAPLVESAFEGYAGGEAGPDLRARREESAPRLEGFLVERLAAIAERAGARYDELAALRAVALDDGFVPADLLRRLEALRALRGSDDFLALAAAAKRVRNILGQAQERGDVAAAGALAERLSEPAELELADAVAGTELRVREARGRGDHEEALRAVAALRPEVDRFFDEIMVMAEDDGLRRARLGLIARIHSLAHETVDLAEIVVEGHERRTKSAARARGAEKGAGGR